MVTETPGTTIRTRRRLAGRVFHILVRLDSMQVGKTTRIDTPEDILSFVDMVPEPSIWDYVRQLWNDDARVRVRVHNIRKLMVKVDEALAVRRWTDFVDRNL